MKTRSSNVLFRRVLVRTLTELVPPIAIASFGRGMVLVGHALESAGKTLQSSGAVVEAYGEQQMLRSSTWLMPTPATPAPDDQHPDARVSPATAPYLYRMRMAPNPG
jgi:hypothetical protein